MTDFWDTTPCSLVETDQFLEVRAASIVRVYPVLAFWTELKTRILLYEHAYISHEIKSL
jgi:hypothetical protein